MAGSIQIVACAGIVKGLAVVGGLTVAFVILIVAVMIKNFFIERKWE